MKHSQNATLPAANPAIACLMVLRPVHPGSSPGVHWAERQRNLYFACKRMMDIVAAAVLLIGLAPLLLLVAVLIRLESPGPAIFRQERLTSRRVLDGQGEVWTVVPFVCYKFRSMYHGVSSDLHRAYIQALMRDDQDQMARLQGGQTAVCKLRRDPRVTRVGCFIRKTSIDELPQLWNVLRGEMSLVGPRPPLRYEVEAYQAWHRQRLIAKPGMTGWWQITGRGLTSFDEGVRRDIWYVEHQSLKLDVLILLRTPFAVLSARGAL